MRGVIGVIFLMLEEKIEGRAKKWFCGSLKS
jgi:hypothetical protein